MTSTSSRYERDARGIAVVSPAPLLGTLELCQRLHPLHRWARKAMVLQVAASATVAIVGSDGKVHAVAGGYPIGDRALELWFEIAPGRADLIRPLLRLARLTLPEIAENGFSVRAVVGPTPSERGRRLARIFGFRRAAVEDGAEVWEWATL